MHTERILEFRMRVLSFLCGLAVFALSVAHAQSVPPVEAYGRLPVIAGASISPDGSRVALALNPGERSRVTVLSIDNPSSNRADFAVPEGNQLRAVDWADNRRVSYVVSQTFRPGDVLPVGVSIPQRRIDYFRTGLIDVNTRSAEIVVTDPDRPWASAGGSLISPIEGDPDSARMIAGAPGIEGGYASVFRIDLASGRARHTPIPGTNRYTAGFVLDEAGTAVLRIDTEDRTNRWRVFIYEDRQSRLLKEGVSEYGEPINVQGLLPDGRILVAEPAEGGDLTELFVMSRTDGSLEPFYRREGSEISGVFADPWTRRIVGAVFNDGQTSIHFFDDSLRAVQERINAAFSGDSVTITSWSQDRSRFLLYVERGLDGGGYYIFDVADGRIRVVGMRYPELAAVGDAGERQAITYRARDGVRVPAILTLPAGVERRNLALVVLPHGGPHNVRDDLGFDWWAAFLVSRGYAVLQPNFRGSGGYGQAWEDAGRRQWGRVMQTDVEDGVLALARAGMIDAEHVCIVGASYGGYAALAGLTLTPERYTCAASVAGVSDLELMLGRMIQFTGGRDSGTSDWWRDSIGDRVEDREEIRAYSPINHVESAIRPLLLIHGDDDTVVPIEQSRRMLARMQAAGKDVRFVELSGDDHWLSDAATRIAMLTELESFLGRHLRRSIVEVDPGNDIPTAPRR
jgi:dipeptidyl aminopeptidase/acylaminoacyl peptidase